MKPCGHRPRDMCDIRHHIRPHLVADLADTLEIEGTGIGAGTRNDQLRTGFQRDFFHFFVVDQLRFARNAVRHDFEIFSRDIDGRAVRQVPAVGKVHAHDRISRLEHGEINRKIRLRAAVRLHVAMVAAEQLLQSVAREVFRPVHKFAAAVIAFAGQALRVFVGEVRPRRGQYGGRNDVFAGDQLDIALLAFQLRVHRGVKFGIGIFNGGHINHTYTSFYYTIDKLCLNRARKRPQMLCTSTFFASVITSCVKPSKYFVLPHFRFYYNITCVMFE